MVATFVHSLARASFSVVDSVLGGNNTKRKRKFSNTSSKQKLVNFSSSLLWIAIICSIVCLSKWQPFHEKSPDSSIFPKTEQSPVVSPAVPFFEQVHRALSGGSSLFGIMSELDPVKGTLSFLIIVAAVLVVEFLFEGLMFSTNDTPFQKLIPYVQKELMVAGCTAFAFKVIVNASDKGLDEAWFEGLEYADLVVPIFSFIYCGFGIFLIVAAGKQCHEWSKAYRHHLLDLFNDFFDYTLTWKFRYFWWFPTQVTDKVEFRIFHNIFCDTYKIQRSAFAFDEYVDHIFEELVLESIEIRPRDWIVVSILFTFNLLRLIADFGFGSSCEHEDHHCRDEGMSKLFALGGGLLVAYSFIVAVYTRYLKLKIMEKKGVKSIEQYHKYLHHMEISKDKADNEKRKGLDELKAVVDELKNAKERENKSITRFLTFKYWHDLYKNFGKKQISTVVTALVSGANSTDSVELTENDRVLLNQWKVIAEDVEREIEESRKGIVYRAQSQSIKLGSPGKMNDEVLKKTENYQEETVDKTIAKPENTGNGDGTAHATDSATKTTLPSHQLVLSSMGAISHHFAANNSEKAGSDGNLPSQQSNDDIDQKLEDEEIALNFPFGEPEIYFEMIQLLILLISIYSALWVSNFIVVGPTTYKGVTVIPIVIASFFFISVISTAALLKAVSEFDNDVVLEVIESTESSKILAKTVREKIVIRLRELSGNTHDISEGLTALFKLFKQIDANGNGLLSQEEFAEFLHAVDINFSRKKWNQIFRDIDLSHDDKISFNEFFMFVFLHDNRQPDPDEVARVEHLSKEVQKKRTLFEKMVKIRRQSVFYPFAARKPGSVIPGNIASSPYAQGKSDQNQSFVDENDDDNNSLAKALSSPEK